MQILAAAGEDGCPANEMLELTDGHFSNVFNLGQTLRRMNESGLVVGKGKNPTRWFLPEHCQIPTTKTNFPHSINTENDTNGHVKLAAFAETRSGTDVTVYVSPEEFTDVVQIQVRQSGNWFKLPLWGALRICIGPSVPKWSPNQEVNLGVTEIRVVFKGGAYKDIRVPQSYPVTIAPME